MIELLVSHGADISAKTDEGWSALGLVAKRHKVAAVQALGEAGPLSKPFVKDISRQTPIQMVEKNEAQIEDPFFDSSVKSVYHDAGIQFSSTERDSGTHINNSVYISRCPFSQRHSPN